MYAIVDIQGQQFKVEKDQKVFVHRLEGENGSNVEFDRVLLIDNEKSVTVGTPVISGALVKAEILEQVKSDKVIVFKKKRRKGYKVKNGHRQQMTQILIQDIIEKGAKKSEPAAKAAPAAKKEAPAATEAKKEAPKSTEAGKPAAAAKPAAEKKTATKPAAEKKTAAAKKPAAKKPAAKAGEKAATAKKDEKKPAAKKPAAKKSDTKSE